MPKLSLYRPTKQHDYRFIDKTISEQLTVGGTDLYVHKYLGPANTGPSSDFTQPQYLSPDPTKIQDLLFLENRDRVYDQNIYRLRGQYSVQNLDFDLSQFGLFLNNDIIFIVVHYNNMIDLVGRKLMVGDVIELPHLIDYDPLDGNINIALKRFYQITDSNFASEGFSPTWFPHLWRIKCEPLVNTEEFQNILKKPTNEDTYLGNYDLSKPYLPGYTVQWGGKIYESIKEVPIGKNPPDTIYWKESADDSLVDILSTYNKNIAINDAALKEAKRILPKSGYDNSPLYVVPTYGEYEANNRLSNKLNQPANPMNLVINKAGAPIIATVNIVQQDEYLPSMVLSIPKTADQIIWDGIVNKGPKLQVADNLSLETIVLGPWLSDTKSGPASSDTNLVVNNLGNITGLYSTADNTHATADINTSNESTLPNMTAGSDPRFQFIAKSTPRSFGYTAGYLTGTDKAPNGFASGAGIAFPENPQVGDYFLRIDYYPQLLYRWDGKVWVRISANVRTGTGLDDEDKSQLSSFINNNEVTKLTSGETVPQTQSLSKLLAIAPDKLPPQP